MTVCYTLSLVIPRNEYQVALFAFSGDEYQRFTSFNNLRALSVFESFRKEQSKLPRETLVVFLEDDRFIKGTLSEIAYLGHGRIRYLTKDYTELTSALREKTQAIWNRTEFHKVH